MKITILTVGTRGDVQPYIALAKGLQSAGYTVKVASGTNFESFVRDNGVDFAPLRADYFDLMDTPEGQALKSGNPIRVMQNMKTTVFPLMRRMFDDSWTAAQGSDAVIFHPKVLIGGHIAEALNIPAMIAATVPLMHPTSAFPAPGMVGRSLGPFNKMTYSAVSMISAPFKGMIQEWRRDLLKLAPQSKVVNGFKMHGRTLPTLYCYSSHVLPVPSDWDDTAHVTGYWFLDGATQWQPPADLKAFLADGSAPVYVGFGSMVANDPQRTTQIVIEALQKSGQRGLIASGWGGLKETDLPSTIYRLKEAPHDWLFPQMAAVVHHGGAGTVAAGLRAGKPTVICPFIADQPFWGSVIQQAGAGPAPIPQKKLTVDNLAAAIHIAATDDSMRRKAAQIGEQLRREDGVANAVKVVGSIIGMPQREMA